MKNVGTELWNRINKEGATKTDSEQLKQDVPDNSISEIQSIVQGLKKRNKQDASQPTPQQ